MKDKAGELINGFPTESSLFDWVRAVASVLRGGPSVFDHVLDTAQRNTLSSVLAVMSVLEGHADTVMDNVSHRDIPSARALRRRFDARRNALTRRQEIIGRLLGRTSNRTSTGLVPGSSAMSCPPLDLTPSTRFGAHPTTCPPPRNSTNPIPGSPGSHTSHHGIPPSRARAGADRAHLHDGRCASRYPRCSGLLRWR